MNNEIINEIEFYEQKLKESRSKLYESDWADDKSIRVVFDQHITDKFSIYNGDCIEVLKGVPSNSIHYSIYSPPFSNLFCYSNSSHDMGNCTDSEFYEHFKFLIPELYRTMMPGRLMSIHCSDIPSMKEKDGVIGLKDFPGIILRAFQEAGFIYHSKVMITKDPLLEAVRTKAIGLLHKQICKDSTRCRNGLPDYVLTIKKPGENPEPVTHKNGFETYIGDGHVPDENEKNEIQGKNTFSHKIWRRYAASVWDDINQTKTLNAKMARESGDEKHLCPLQTQVIERCISLWSNPGDVVLTPFLGVGSESYIALKMGRKTIGIELKASYYKTALKNLLSVKKGLKGFNLE